MATWSRRRLELRDATDTLGLPAVAESFSHDVLDRCLAVVNQASPSHFLTNGFAYYGNDCVTAIYSPKAMIGADPNNYVSNQYDERCFVFKTTDSASPNLFQKPDRLRL